MLAAPVLMIWCQFCNRRKKSYIWHGATVILLGYISSLTIHYTYILPLHGGGRYLFGGTYLLLYYIGILFANFRLFCFSKGKRKAIFLLAFCSWFVWWILICSGKLPFDSWFAAYWGEGFNPPSVQFMVFAIIMLVVCYSFFSLLEEGKCVITKNIIYVITLVGKNTLYIFMYHLMIQHMIRGCVPVVYTNIWTLRFGVFLPMLILPVFAVETVRKIKRQL